MTMKRITTMILVGLTVIAVSALFAVDVNAGGGHHGYYRGHGKAIERAWHGPCSGYTVIKKRVIRRNGRTIVIKKIIDPWGNVRIIRRVMRPGWWYGRPHRSRVSWRRGW